jgi:hypothetical protein
MCKYIYLCVCVCVDTYLKMNPHDPGASLLHHTLHVHRASGSGRGAHPALLMKGTVVQDFNFIWQSYIGLNQEKNL